MRAMRSAFLGAVLLVTPAACSGPPTASLDDPFDWTAELQGLPEALLSVWNHGNEAVIAGGDNARGLILEWDGGPAWTAPLLPEGASLLWWTWALPGGDAYAVGESATLLRRRDGLWRAEPIEGLLDPATAFYGVWGSSSDDVWVVGGSFNPGVPPVTMLHWDGLMWSVAEPGVEFLLFKVWGTAANDVWAVGLDGVTTHFDGTAWTAQPSGTTQRLIAVSGRSADEVYAVGGDGAGLVLRWDGAAWSEFGQTPEPLSAVWTMPGHSLYVGGTRGYLARYGRRDIGPVALPELISIRPLESTDFHSLSGDDTRVIAVGANILGGSVGMRDGANVIHGPGTTTMLVRTPIPDAGIPDAPVDAAPDVLSVPGPGDLCGFNDAGIPVCQPGLECWFLMQSGDKYLCTQSCVTVDDCDAYGAGAVCKRPGFQTLTTVCIPASLAGFGI